MSEDELDESMVQETVVIKFQKHGDSGSKYGIGSLPPEEGNLKTIKESTAQGSSEVFDTPQFRRDPSPLGPVSSSIHSDRLAPPAYRQDHLPY